MIQRASAFSRSVVVAELAALSEKVEVEGSCYREPLPLVAISLSRNLVAFSEKVEV